MISGFFQSGAATVFEYPTKPVLLISGSCNAFNEGFNGCGIYMVSGLYVSQTFRLPGYIGSSNDLDRRLLTDHIPQLNRNGHDNSPLQKSWLKYGQDNFVWWLLETCPEEIQFQREQYYLDTVRPFVDEFGGFNIAHYVMGTMKGRKHTDETKKMYRVLRAGEGNPFWGKKHSPETRAKMKKARNKRFSPLPKGRNAKLSKHFRFINPNGELIEGIGLENFCLENNLNRAHMRGVKSGRRKSHKGWTKVPEF
jgi:group I intron endonuclease